ncbi:Short-chain dehydrogenase [Sphingomonas guangdongensis]|uniref:Short-chain dehydrogenase n=1 Tax=Sphingomonas guangdongensis TaxID=1141890 RepID=A0A285QDK2_9SPHN|nr:SDR family oxidoreductase [Sphingomonas guangdongensis]SOB79554.1 Short-chain dehydrogenase [Sphingomonas guangdongensis]
MRSIFITGGASGIGRATAILFADRGWRVGLADVNDTGLAETRAVLEGAGHSLHRLDVRDRAGWDAALADFAGTDGGIDVLFNNAGINVGGPFAETSVADIERAIAINLTGVIHGAHAAYRYLKAATPGACLLNTASAAGLFGVNNAAVYSATKFGVRGLTESLDLEWARDGITVAALLPSFIDTPLLDVVPTGSNATTRDRVRAAGLEFTPVEEVAQAAWAAVHGTRVHYPVGRTARRIAFAARWMPARFRRSLRGRRGL